MTNIVDKMLLGAGIGFMLGGPFGSILGAALSGGAAALAEPATADFSERTGNSKPLTNQVAALLTMVARADRNLQPTEARTIAEIFKDHFHIRQDGLADVRESMKKAAREMPDVKTIAATLKKMTSPEERVWILTLAWRVALADGPANYSERTCIASAGAVLGVSEFQQQSLASEYLHPKNQNYDVLGINPAASVDLIRRAYKQMARDNHPDRVSHLGEFKARQANEKFARITQAYDAIRKERGF